MRSSITAWRVLGVLCACALSSQAEDGVPKVSPSEPPTAPYEIVTNPDASYVERRKAITSLVPTPDEVVGLRKLIGDAKATKALLPQQERVFMNDLMLLLCKVLPEGGGLEDELIAIGNDRARDFAVRDYAWQHLFIWYPKSGDKPRCIEALLGALDEKENSPAGAAALALARLALEHPDIDRRKIADRVVAMVGDDSRSSASRASALQACVALGERGALPSARKLLRSEHRPLSVSAIACLGALGTDDDLPILLAISNESDDLRRNAADKAVAKLGRRIGSKRRGGPQ